MSRTLTVDIDDLITGRVVGSPIHDCNGELLLAARCAVTNAQKQRIKDRGITRVVIDEADAEHLRRDRCAPPADANADDGGESPESANEAQDLAALNNGPALRDSLVRHGGANYDADLRQAVEQRRSENAQGTDRLLKQVLDGSRVEGEAIVELAATQLKDLVADCDCTISVMFGGLEDPSLAQRALKLSLLAMAIGIELGLDADNVRAVGIAGLVQEWGLARVPRAIREANRPLTALERLEIQKHPAYSLEMLQGVGGIEDIVRLVVYQSHERPDGSGYPRGLEGASIHPFARICHVADAYTTLVEATPQRRGTTPYDVMASLIRQAQHKRCDAAVVRSLLHVLSLFPIGSQVTLSDGSIARVLRSNGADYTRPVVQVLTDAQGRPLETASEASVLDLKQSPLQVVRALPAHVAAKPATVAVPPAARKRRSCTPVS